MDDKEAKFNMPESQRKLEIGISTFLEATPDPVTANVSAMLNGCAGRLKKLSLRIKSGWTFTVSANTTGRITLVPPRLSCLPPLLPRRSASG